MKRTFVVLLALIPFLLQAQSKQKTKKYPSLLWEISGNGLKKPSYLFGTMHVSSKLAFHLADSFYLGIRNADVVALETNPESWQEDMSKYELNENGYSAYGRFGGFLSIPNDYLSINTLRFYKYDKKIERSLYSNPSTINNLLYRSYGNDASDFEEDTYLDMYIYQCGKKWGKRVAGVERYAESMKLMQEAYKDAARDRNKKRSFDVDEEYSTGKLQEAYRKGNLDQLDSINKLNSFSDAFDEKFLYRRNEIQANSIDSILKSRSTLFVGVGAAHLPGKRGVIEMLRDKGYTLRPVLMGERDSRHKDEVEKVRVPVLFQPATAADSFFRVDIPGKFYSFGDDGALDQLQYADMANGSYYMVTRIMTNAWMWGHHTEDVYRKIDSLLYENIPGKMISRSTISRNGYQGFDITNRTRRGDVQRYNIFITPFEVIVFKMSGTGDYVRNGQEADKFFGSIALREYGSLTPHTEGWRKYTPPYGGFSVQLPHDPYIGNDGSWIYDAKDKQENTFFRIVRTDIHNYHFAEEDTFDLGLMDESFSASEFIDKKLSRKHLAIKGYPALDCRYRGKNGAVFLTRFIIRGPHYYTLVAYGRQETSKMRSFLDSFEPAPYIYSAARELEDTSLYFKVKTAVMPEQGKEKLDIPRYNYFAGNNDEESEEDMLEEGAYRSRVISNDTTGEKIYVAFYKSPRYYYRKDSTELEKDQDISMMGDTTWIVKSRKKYELPGKIKVWELLVTDSGSSRAIWNKRFYKDGIGFSIMTQTDTLTPPSAFVKTFFDTFKPADTLKGIDLFARKSGIFFSDFLGKDSVAHKRAVRYIERIVLDSTDLPMLKTAIRSLGFEEKNYLDTKKSLVAKLAGMNTKAAADYLNDIYYAAGDTIELQYAALESLLQHRTQYAFNVFRNIIVTEPPILEKPAGNDWDYSRLLKMADISGGPYNYSNSSFLDELNDSLALTRTIMPDLMPLLNLEDYKEPMMTLLGRMVDSNLVSPKDYETYFSKFLIEAKQEMKKQAIKEKKKAIEKAEENKTEKNRVDYYTGADETDKGNERLALYATLLLPYWDLNPAVQPLIRQMLHSNDKRLKYNTLMLLIRKNKSYPDSLLKYFATRDEYRYELYRDLKEISKLGKFPAAFNNHLDLGRSALLDKRSYGKPDTIAYLNRLATTFKGKKGFIYFFKYKAQKEDMNWKLATVGLVPEDPRQFEVDDAERAPGWTLPFPGMTETDNFDFTALTDTRIDKDLPIAVQLNKELKKLMYSRRKSGKEFYGESRDAEVTEYLTDGTGLRNIRTGGH